MFGGKADSLIALTEFANVPPFIVITPQEVSGLSDESLQMRLRAANVGPPYAVRSSANVEDGSNASFAGLFTTHLRVANDGLTNSIASVIDSVNDPRVKEYCESQDISDDIKMNVVIQKLVDADASGVCLTKVPEQNENVITVEAVWGLGELLVSGTVEPDHYEIDRDSFAIIKSAVGNQMMKESLSTGRELVDATQRRAPKLTSEQIVSVAREACRIEEQMNLNAVDIEFAFHNDELFILQARPVASI